MEYTKLDNGYDSDIVMIDCTQEPITSKENIKKPKTKKAKRKVKVGKNDTNNTETLYITQQLKVKRTKFSCVINVHNVYEKKKRRPSSIIRVARNECKQEAYHNRIVPVCMRKNCFRDGLLKCCRTAGKREYRIRKSKLKLPTQKKVVLSPVSSLSLSSSAKISYEDVSDKSFSSEDELDTLIKRTKERENKLYRMKPFNTPIPTYEDVASPYSASLHSTSTLLLQPETDVYSPTTSPSYMCNVSRPYSPKTPDWVQFGNYERIESQDTYYNGIDTTKTPDWTKMKNCEPIESQDAGYKGVDIPYSPTDPTNTPNINETEINEDYKPENDGIKGYSAASPPHVKIEADNEDKNHVRGIVDMQNGRNVKTERNKNSNLIKIKDIKREEESENEDHNNAQYFETEINGNDNCFIKTEKIKRENENACDVNDNFEVFVKV